MEDNRIREQRRLAELVIIRDDYSKTEYVAGIDYAIVNGKIIVAAIVCNKDMKIIDKTSSIKDSENEKGLYKEASSIIEAVNKLNVKPDIMLVNGHGISHARLGIASYVGVALNLPTIGVAKGIITGKVIDGLLYVQNEIRGYEMETRAGSKPVYVSPGHKVSLKSSISLTKEMIKWPHKLPEPLALAHKYLNKLKKGILSETRQ